MILNIAEKPEVAEKFIYFVFFKTKEKRFLVCHFKNTLETLFCTTEESEFVREEIQVTLKNYCWLFLWILAEESRNRCEYCFKFHKFLNSFLCLQIFDSKWFSEHYVIFSWNDLPHQTFLIIRLITCFSNFWWFHKI